MVYHVEFIKEPQEILDILTKTSIYPLTWDSFPEIIIHDLTYFSAKLLLLKENENISSHILLYWINDEILYFGHVHAVSVEKLEKLIKELLDYARSGFFQKIIGPINIPTILYGWGFLKKGGEDTLSLAKPINPPWMQETFFKHLFKIKIEYYTWEGIFVDLHSDPPQLTGMEDVDYEFPDYEILQVKTWEELKALKMKYFLLSGANLSPESQVTPDVMNLFDNYLKFIIKYGDPFMFGFLKHLPSNSLVGLINAFPNPFKKQDKGKSMVVFVFVLNKEHRDKKLGMWMAHDLLTRAMNKGYTHLTAPIERNQMESQGMCKKLGLSHTRTHLVLKFDL